MPSCKTNLVKYINPHRELNSEDAFNQFMSLLKINLDLFKSRTNTLPHDEFEAILKTTAEQNIMFRIIYNTMKGDPYNDPGTVDFLKKLSNSFKYDTEHDFGVGSTRILFRIDC